MGRLSRGFDTHTNPSRTILAEEAKELLTSMKHKSAQKWQWWLLLLLPPHRASSSRATLSGKRPPRGRLILYPVIFCCCLFLLFTLCMSFAFQAEGGVLHAEAATLVSRPDSLLYVSFTDSRFPDAQPEQFAGIAAAFLEANEDPSVLLGTRLDLMAVNATDEALAIADTLNYSKGNDIVLKYLQNESIAGLVANSQLLGTSLSPLTPSSSMPVFGLNAASEAHLSVSHVVQLRGLISNEFPNIIKFGMHRAGLHCTTLLLIHFYIGNITALLPFVYAHGYGYPDRVERTTTAYDTAELFAKLLQTPRHSCIAILDLSAIIEVLVPRIMSIPGFEKTPILTVSFSGRPKFGNAASFSNVYMTQVVPDPDDAQSSRFVARYQRAMTHLLNQTSFVNTTFDFARPVSFFNYQSLEGYILGRLIVEGARGTSNLTRQGIVDTIYRQRMILLDDFSLGPYTRGCTLDASFPCDCHNGLRIITVSRIDPATGKSVGQRDRPEEGEIDLAVEQAALTSCTVRKLAIRRPFNLLLPLPVTFGTTETWRADAVGRFSSALRNASYGLSLVQPFRTDGSLRVVQTTLSTTDRTDPSGATVTTLSQRYMPFVVAGAAGGTPIFVNGTSMLLTTLGALPLKPPAADMTLSKGQFDLDGSVAEFAHAVASYAARLEQTRGTGGATAASGVPAVVAATTVEADLAVQSLHTFGLQPSSVTTVVGVSAAASVVEGFLRAGTPVMVVAQDEGVLGAAMGAIITTTSPVGGASAAPVAPAFVVAEEAAVYRAMLAALQTSSVNRLLVPRPVFFASVMRPWWQATSFGKTALSLARRDPTDTAYAEDPAHAKATLVADIVYHAAVEALRLQALTGHPPSFAASLYSAGTLQAGEITLGPFNNATCANAIEAASPQRLCNCAKGPRSFYVHDLRDLLANSATSATGSHQHSVKGCTITYLELPAATAAGNEGLVFGLIGGGVGLIAIVAVIALTVLCCCGGKSNWTAPKDEGKPFAIAFTDIQSSTALWARAPAEMAAAVETHHAILRRCLRAHKGYEVKTIGDSFMVAFTRVVDAAQFAVRVQHALHDADWGSTAIDDIYRDMTRERLERNAAGGSSQAAAEEASDWDHPQVYAPLWNGLRVRVGVHFGFGRVVKDPTSGGFDYYGTVVNTAARVEAVGNGGQVLLTGAALAEVLHVQTSADDLRTDLEARVTAALDESVRVVDLGPQPLRGLDQPVALFQLNPSALGARRFPALRLDVEVAVDDHQDGISEDRVSIATHTTATAHSTFGSAADAATAAAAALPPSAGAAFLEQFRLLETVLSTSAVKWRWETLRSLAEAWRVRLPDKGALLRKLDPAKRGPADADSQASLLAVVELLKKVSRVHAARTFGASTGIPQPVNTSSSMSRSNSLSLEASGILSRRGIGAVNSSTPAPMTTTKSPTSCGSAGAGAGTGGTLFVVSNNKNNHFHHGHHNGPLNGPLQSPTMSEDISPTSAAGGAGASGSGYTFGAVDDITS